VRWPAPFLVAFLLLGMPLRASAQDTAATQPAPVLTDDQMFHKYIVSTVGPPGLIGAAAAAGYEQYVNYPAEWRQTGPGYAKRFASAYAAGAIGNSTKYAIAHFLHQDPSFARCRCTGLNRRMRHAVTSVFTARTQTGREVFSPATIGGYAAEHVVPAALWFPPNRFRTEGLALLAASIGSKIGVNILHEFFGKPKIVISKD
jgi:hypothetical protein